MVRNYLILICLGILVQGSAFAQRIRNIQASQEGQAIRISYTLESEYNCNVSAFVSTDNGMSWSPLLTVEGDIGQKIKPGNNSFLWRVTQDRENLIGESIKFKVLANEIIPKTSELTNYSKYSVNYDETKMFRNNGMSHFYGINSLPNALYMQGGANNENSSVSVLGSTIFPQMRTTTLNTTAYVDGIPVTNQMTGSALEWIDPLMVDEISVSPQVNSPENGSGLGTVNVKLARPQTDGLAVTTTNSISSFGGIKTMNQVVVGDARNFVAATSNFTQNRGYMENEFGKKNQYSIHGRLGNSKVRHSFFVNNYLFRTNQGQFLSLDQFLTNPQEGNAYNTNRAERFGGGYGVDIKLNGDWSIKAGMSWNRHAYGNYYTQYDVVLDSNVEKHDITDEFRSFVQRIEISKRIQILPKESLLITIGEEGQANRYRDENFIDNLQNSQLISGMALDSYVSGTQFSPFVKALVDSKRWKRVGAYISLGKNSNSWYAKYENENEQVLTLNEYKLGSPLNAKFGGYAQLNDKFQVNGQLSWGYQQPFLLPMDNMQNTQGVTYADLSRHELGVKGNVTEDFAFDVSLYRSNQKFLQGMANIPPNEAGTIKTGGIEFGAKYKIPTYMGYQWSFFTRGNVGSLNLIDPLTNLETEITGVPRNKMFLGAQFDSDNISVGVYDYWRSKMYVSGDGSEWINGGHELNSFVSFHSNPDGADAFISLDLGINNALNTKVPMSVSATSSSLFPAPSRNYYANIRFNANLSGMDGITGGGYDWIELSNFYFGFRNFMGSSTMNAAYGLGVQGHWPGNSNPISTSTTLFYGLGTSSSEFYTRLFAIPDGEISTKGTPMAFSLGQNVELALINGYTKLSVGVGPSLNIYSVAEPSTYNYSYGYLFADKLFLVSPGIDLSANLYIDGAVTLGFTYSKCAKTSLSNDDSDTPNYLYSEEVDLSNWALRIGFMFN